MLGSQRESAIHSNNNNALIGPGAYDIDIDNKHKLLQYSWSRASRFKTTPHSESRHSPGPGAYQCKMKGASFGAQFVFKSKLKKSLEFAQEKISK